MTAPTPTPGRAGRLSTLVLAVTVAVDDLEQHLRHDPMDYLGFQHLSDLRHSIRRLERIENDEIDP